MVPGCTHPLDPESAAPMALARCLKKNQADVRFVLFKGTENEAFVFFTDYTSKKARDFSENSSVAVAFYGVSFRRQVRIRVRSLRSKFFNNPAYSNLATKTTPVKRDGRAGIFRKITGFF